jgi:hypothetical protein
MDFDFSREGLLKIIEHDFKRNGWPREVKDCFEGRRYNFNEVIGEIKNNSDLGNKVSLYYMGYLE